MDLLLFSVWGIMHEANERFGTGKAIPWRIEEISSIINISDSLKWLLDIEGFLWMMKSIMKNENDDWTERISTPDADEFFISTKLRKPPN